MVSNRPQPWRSCLLKPAACCRRALCLDRSPTPAGQVWAGPRGQAGGWGAPQVLRLAATEVLIPSSECGRAQGKLSAVLGGGRTGSSHSLAEKWKGAGFSLTSCEGLNQDLELGNKNRERLKASVAAVFS